MTSAQEASELEQAVNEKAEPKVNDDSQVQFKRPVSGRRREVRAKRKVETVAQDDSDQ